MEEIIGEFGLMKVPQEAIIEKLIHEIKEKDSIIRDKANKIKKMIAKYKEREEHWQAYAQSLVNTIQALASNDEDAKQTRLEVRAKKKLDEDYQILVKQNQNQAKKIERLELRIASLEDQLNSKPTIDNEIPRKKLQKAFDKRQDRKEIMKAMNYPCDESMPIAFVSVGFLEWVRINAKWDELLSLMERGISK